jgi:hypothetical protein
MHDFSQVAQIVSSEVRVYAMDALALAPRLGSNVAGLVGEQLKHIRAATVLQAYARRWLVPRVFTSRWRRRVCEPFREWQSLHGDDLLDSLLWEIRDTLPWEIREGFRWGLDETEEEEDITDWYWVEGPDFDEKERSVRADVIVAKAIARAVDHERQYWHKYWEEQQDDHHDANA